MFRRALTIREAALGNDHLAVATSLSDVGRSEYHKLQSAITVLSLHLLKWDHQPAKRSRSWELSIYEQRERIADSLADNPGLKFRLPDAILRGYKYGRVDALKETKLPKSVLPIDCPFSFDDLMTRPIVYEPPAPKRKKR